MEGAVSAGAIGLDTEFMRERTYHPRLCLVQVAVGDNVYLVDATPKIDLSGIGRLVADPRVRVVLHAGKQDLEIFFDAFGVVPVNVFDVQVAAAFAGYGSALPYGRLVETAVGVKLVKGESYSDWCRRPLTRAQLRYAADDVRYLLPAAQRLEEDLRRLGRAAWVAEEMKSFEDPSAFGTDPDRAWLKVAGRGSLTGRQTEVLKEVARWRETTAKKRDLPRGWIVKDPTLVEIARRRPGSLQELRAIRGMAAGEAERSGAEILEAVARGERRDVEDRPRQASKAAQTRARILAGLADAVVRARCDRAGIAADAVATKSELEELIAGLASGDPGDHRLLAGWRRDLAGNAILDLVAGRTAVKATNAPPYIEEVAADA